MANGSKKRGVYNVDLQLAVVDLYAKKIISKDKEIADKMEVGQGTVSNYINGMAKASPNFRESFETAFNLKLSDFPQDWPPDAKGAESSEAVYREKYYDVLERERKALEEDKAFFKDILKTSLAVILVDVQSIASRQKGAGETILHALEGLTKKAPGTLVKEADKRIRQIEKGAHTRDSEAAVSK